MKAARIAGLGRYVPKRVVTNDDLARKLDSSDQWIRERTGIRERRLAADHETASSMGVLAAQEALAMAGVDGADLDLIIVATATGDALFPPVSCLIQERLGASRAAAFDIGAACVGFVAGLATASQFIATGAARRVLVVGSEVLSRIVDWSDRATCVLFGDGAGAALLEASDTGRGVPLSFVLHSDGGGADILYAQGPSSARSPVPAPHYFVVMDGPAVFKFAVNAMEGAVREALGRAGLTPADVDLFVPHQANQRIISAAARALGLPPEKVVTNIDRYGNTSAASIPIALCEALEQGRLREGDRVALAAFGGGLVWGAMILEWTAVGPRASERTAVAEPVGGGDRSDGGRSV